MLIHRSECSPVIGLIDDDSHSAHLFARMLPTCDGLSVRHYGDAEGISGLARDLDDPRSGAPTTLVVDLKGHRDATLEFLSLHRDWLQQQGIATLAMVPPTDRMGRNRYIEAGAAAVFFRQPELDAYRREMVGIANFQARNQRLDAVGM